MRVPLLQVNTAVSTLTAIRQELNLLKSRQSIDSYNLVTHITETSNSYDWTFSAPTDSYAGGIKVVFSADIQEYPPSTLTYRIYSGSMSNEVTVASNLSFPTVSILHDIASDTAPRQSSWELNFYNQGPTATLYVKFYVNSTDTGSLVFIT